MTDRGQALKVGAAGILCGDSISGCTSRRSTVRRRRYHPIPLAPPDPSRQGHFARRRRTSVRKWRASAPFKDASFHRRPTASMESSSPLRFRLRPPRCFQLTTSAQHVRSRWLSSAVGRPFRVCCILRIGRIGFHST